MWPWSILPAATGQFRSAWANINVAILVEDEVGCSLLLGRSDSSKPARAVRCCDDQPFEQPDRAIYRVACEPLRPQIEAALNAVHHRREKMAAPLFGLLECPRHRRRDLVVDQASSDRRKKGSRPGLATHVACGSVSETCLGGLRRWPPLPEPSSPPRSSSPRWYRGLRDTREPHGMPPLPSAMQSAGATPGIRFFLSTSALIRLASIENASPPARPQCSSPPQPRRPGVGHRSVGSVPAAHGRTRSGRVFCLRYRACRTSDRKVDLNFSAQICCSERIANT